MVFAVVAALILDMD